MRPPRDPGLGRQQTHTVRRTRNLERRPAAGGDISFAYLYNTNFSCSGSYANNHVTFEGFITNDPETFSTTDVATETSENQQYDDKLLCVGLGVWLCIAQFNFDYPGPTDGYQQMSTNHFSTATPGLPIGVQLTANDASTSAMFDSRYVYTDATTDILSITHQLAQGDAGSKTGNATLFVVKLPISVPTTVYS